MTATTGSSSSSLVLTTAAAAVSAGAAFIATRYCQQKTASCEEEEATSSSSSSSSLCELELNYETSTQVTTTTTLASASNALANDLTSLECVTRVHVYQPRVKPTVVFVLGGPGAGKGTQCGKIVDMFGFCHISAGDCLRAERNKNSPDADLINAYIKNGDIVPVEITVKLLAKAMRESGQSKFLIDGFPRNLNNVTGWEKVVGDSVTLAFVLVLECSEAVMQARLLTRGETSGRIDDNLASITKRFDTFTRETTPIVSYFAAQGLVKHVAAEGSVDTVWQTVQTHFEVFGRKMRSSLPLPCPSSSPGRVTLLASIKPRVSEQAVTAALNEWCHTRLTVASTSKTGATTSSWTLMSRRMLACLK